MGLPELLLIILLLAVPVAIIAFVVRVVRRSNDTVRVQKLEQENAGEHRF